MDKHKEYSTRDTQQTTKEGVGTPYQYDSLPERVRTNISLISIGSMERLEIEQIESWINLVQ